MDPQARAIYQSRVQYLIGMGYTPDAAQQQALKEVQSQHPDQQPPSGISGGLYAGDHPEAPSPPTGEVAASAPPQTPPMSGQARDNKGAGGAATPTPAGQPAQAGGPGPITAAPNQGPPQGPQPPPQGGGLGPGQAPGGPDASAQTGGQGPGYAGLGNDNARTEQIYGLGANEDPRDWANRVFMQSQADNGNSLYADQNVYANTPWARFVKSRYGVDQPMQALMGTLENPVAEGGVPAALRDSMKGMAVGGGSPAGGISGLQKVGGLMSQALSGGGGGLDAMQAARLRDVANDPTTSSSMILSQLQGATGGWGMRELTNRLSGLQSHYMNDPYNMDPGQGGNQVPFYNQALKLIGIGG